MKDIITTRLYPTSHGDIWLGADDEGLRLCKWAKKPDLSWNRKASRDGLQLIDGSNPIIDDAVSQLEEFFCRKRKEFKLQLALHGTDFQQRVWQELMSIPYGTTITYGELARRIGNAKASRAVAMACHNNPISIFIPCHRVIGSNGKLTGYAGGLDKKAILLDIENNLFINYFKTT